MTLMRCVAHDRFADISSRSLTDHELFLILVTPQSMRRPWREDIQIEDGRRQCFYLFPNERMTWWFHHILLYFNWRVKKRCFQDVFRFCHQRNENEFLIFFCKTRGTEQLVRSHHDYMCKLPQQSNIKMADWSAKNETHDLPFSPRRRFRISTTDYLYGSRQRHFPVFF